MGNIPEAVLSEIKRDSVKSGIPIISEAAAEFILELIKNANPSNILEIGTGHGYSGTLMLSAVSAKLCTVEIDETRFLKSKENFEAAGITQNVTQHLLDAAEFLRIASGKYDFIFLDGAKGQYLNMLSDLKRLLSRGGLLVSDNIFYHGFVDGSVKLRKNRLTLVENLKAFIEKLTGDKELSTEFFRIGDGISVSRKL